MTNTRRNARLLAIVASVGCVTASIAALAPAASAMIAPLSGRAGSAPATRHLVRTILVSTGMPDWQVVLITTGAAILGAAVAMLIGWTRTRRQSVLPAS
jgi:hypothetical protein